MTNASSGTRSAAFALGSVVWLFASSVRASDADSAAAQVLFDQAKRLMAQGAYAEACVKLEDSQRLDPGSGTLLNLGDCYEHQGKTATAWTKFVEAAEASKSTGKAERERVARERAAMTYARLSRMVIDVREDESTVGLEVKRDGMLVGKSQWGAAVVVDPGRHTVTASAPGRTPWETSLLVQTAGQTVTVMVPVLSVRSSESTSASAGDARPSTAHAVLPLPSTSVGDGQADRKGLGTQRTLALVSGGVGVAGLALGTVFGLQSKSKHDDAENYCVGEVCREQAGVDLKAEAKVAGNISTVAFLVGVAGLAGGAVLWFSAPPMSQGGATVQLGALPGGVMVRGTW